MSISFFQFIIALFLMILILLQGNSSFFSRERFIVEKRGWEKKLYLITWMVGFLFIFSLLLGLFLAK